MEYVSTRCRVVPEEGNEEEEEREEGQLQVQLVTSGGGVCSGLAWPALFGGCARAALMSCTNVLGHNWSTSV